MPVAGSAEAHTRYQARLRNFLPVATRAPPHSSKVKEFPEIDRAEFFPIEEAKRKINEAQIAFLDRLAETLGPRNK